MEKCKECGSSYFEKVDGGKIPVEEILRPELIFLRNMKDTTILTINDRIIANGFLAYLLILIFSPVIILNVLLGRFSFKKGNNENNI